MIKQELIILVGNIGSGKSTLSNQLAKEGYFIVSQDDLRYSIGAGKYIFNMQCEEGIKDACVVLARKFMSNDLPLVIDETNMNCSTRLPYLYLGTYYNYPTKAIIFPSLSKKESIKRRLKNNHGNTSKEIWEKVWDQFNDRYQEPTEKEGFDEIIDLKGSN